MSPLDQTPEAIAAWISKPGVISPQIPQARDLPIREIYASDALDMLARGTLARIDVTDGPWEYVVTAYAVPRVMRRPAIRYAVELREPKR